MPKPLTWEEVEPILRDIKEGRLRTKRVQKESPKDTYCGHVLYEIEGKKGWTISVFNDAGEWDYFEEVTKGGRKINHRALYENDRAEAYHPSDFDLEAERIWHWE